ncbi:MAG: hypothetical protein HUJ72_12515 [Blautia sp.]|nr:hypothetical protein [Blautia sp.]
MKKLSTVLLSTVAVVGMAVSANAATAADLPVEPQFDPAADCEQYTVVEYTIEDLNADLVCTVCKTGEDTYQILTNFYGDDQDWKGTYDGSAVTTESDKTGFMEGDAPAIIQKAIDQDLWVAMGEEAEAPADEAAEAPAGEAEKVVWETEPQFAPNPDFEVYTVVEYTIEDLNADLVCTVCKKGEDTYDILTNFYGDDQDWIGTFDGEAVITETDKTGFMEGDAPAIIKLAEENTVWANVADDTVVGGAAEEAPAADAAEEAPAADAAAFPTEPQFDPNPDYETYTVVEYTIEDLNADLVCTVCKKGENEYEILTNFYGDDQDWAGTYDGSAVTTTSDKTGFMEGDAPAIIQKAIDQDIWAPIA